ncbi:hypothetical protein RMP42_04867 [Roseomonas mucosa]|nr:hypothetical protein RMP42_04867 [Roseomonas mucosa]
MTPLILPDGGRDSPAPRPWAGARDAPGTGPAASGIAPPPRSARRNPGRCPGSRSGAGPAP